MACKRIYYGNDKQPSKLYNELVNRFGEAAGEQLYLTSKLPQFETTNLNDQGEPSIQAVMDIDFQIAPKSKVDYKSTRDNMVSSSKVMRYVKADHEYFVNGVQMESVSAVTDRHVLYTGPKTDFNYQEEGTRFHGILQDIINGMPNEDLIKKHTILPTESGFVPFFRNFTNDLKKNGEVIAELRVALVDKKIAGTVDIVHIKKNGKVDIYDLKTAFESPGRKAKGKALWDIYETSGNISNYKAQRYSLQTSYYKNILENSDAITGRKGIEVENVYILPVEVYMDNDQKTVAVSPKGRENIEDWVKGDVDFSLQAENRVRSEIGEGTIIDSELEGFETPSTNEEFMGQIIPKSPLTEQELDRKARMYVENPNNEDGFKVRGVSYRWKGDSRSDKIATVKSVLTSNDDEGGSKLTDDAVLTIQGAPGGYFTSSERGREQLDKIVRLTNSTKALSLATIKGFEKYGDILMMVRPDGSRDLVKLTFDDLRKVIPVANTYKNLIRKHTLHITGSLVGNHVTYEQAKENGILLQNNLGDREQFRLGLVAMELKAANPDMKVNRMLVQSFATKDTIAVPDTVHLQTILPQIKAIYNIPQIRDSVTGRLKQVLDNDELYIADSYDVNPALEFLEYIRTHFLTSKDFLKPESDKKNTRWYNKMILELSVRGEMAKDELAERLIDNERGLRQILRTKYLNLDIVGEDVENAILSDPEYMQLSRTVLALKSQQLYPERDISDAFLGSTIQYLLTPTKTGRRTLDQAIDHLRQGLDTVKNEVTKFNHEKKPILTALMNTDPVWKAGLQIAGESVLSTDTIFGMGQSVFAPLFQTKTNADGTKYPIPWLVTENTAEFRKLNGAQQRTITWLNNMFEHWYQESHSFTVNGEFKDAWVRGMVPILSVSPSSSLYKVKESLMKGDIGKAVKSLKNTFTRSMDILGNHGNFRSPDKTTDKYQVYDFFSRQVNKADNTISSYSLEAIGLDENMDLVDADKHLAFETDLEEIVNQFMSHNVKKREMDKKLPLARMYKSIFKYYEHANFLNQKDSLRMLDNYINDNVFGEKIGADSGLTKVINTSIGISSVMLLGLNWKVFTANGMQMGLSSMTEAMSNLMAGDKRFPRVTANAKAFKEMVKMGNPVNGFEQGRKIELLMELYMPEDITSLKTRRYKVTQKGIIDTQSAFAIDRLAEYGLRTHYLIAQMIQDGTYDAHTVEQITDKNGNNVYRIKYDERLDERFKKDPTLKDAIKAALAEKGEGLTLDEGKTLEDQEMTMAYDWRLKQKYKSYADGMFSSFDKDLKSDIAHYGMFAGFTQFRSWFRDKFVRAIKRDYPNKVIGDYTKVDGKHVWSDEVFKGVFWTIADLGSISKKAIRDKSLKTMSKQDKKNLTLAGNSLAMWTLLAVLIKYAFDDKDDPASMTAKTVAMRGIQDLTSILTLQPFISIGDDPFIFYSYYKNLLNSLGRGVLYASDGEFEDAGVEVMSNVPVVREFQ